MALYLWRLPSGSEPPAGWVWRGSAYVSVLRLTQKARPCTVVEPESVTAPVPAALARCAQRLDRYLRGTLFLSSQPPAAGGAVRDRDRDARPVRRSGHPSRGAAASLGTTRAGWLSLRWKRCGGLAERQPLSCPRVHDARAQLASFGCAVADSDRDAGLYDCVESSCAVTTESIIARALLRLTCCRSAGDKHARRSPVPRRPARITLCRTCGADPPILVSAPRRLGFETRGAPDSYSHRNGGDFVHHPDSPKADKGIRKNTKEHDGTYRNTDKPPHLGTDH